VVLNRKETTEKFKFNKKGRNVINIKVICPKCKSVNTMENFCVFKMVMHERCSECGFIQEMSLDRCLEESIDIIVPKIKVYRKYFEL
jgi:hypothetical protein